jgi:hypothetical protein
MTPDWIVKRWHDRGASWFYRYHVEGVNLNHPEGNPDRRFSWDVPSIDDPRFDFSGAETMARPAVNPTR